MPVTRRFAALLLSLLSIIAVSCAKPASEPKKLSEAEMIARGQYLVTITGCGDCHTPGYFYGAPDETRKLSGSEMGWAGAWGVSYARNLTPEPVTGIGAWSEDDIITAIRQGKRPDGTALMPPMPWVGFAFLADEDARSIAKYLKTIPPVSHKVPDKLPPGSKPTGSYVVIPPPSVWDAPRTP